MAKVSEEFEVPVVNGDYGIEVEIEGANLNVRPAGWQSHDDGSLRGEYPHSRNEFVTHGTVKYIDVKGHFKTLFDALKANGARPSFSYRTSVHVHRNVQQLNGVQLLNLIYTYLLFETSLVRLCGRERVNNRFCLRFQDADGMYDALYAMFSRGVRYLRNHREADIRYSSMNLASLMKFGSIEFRAMRGTNDETLLNNWIEIIQNIYEYASSGKKTPESIREDFLDKGGRGLAIEIFGKELFQVIDYENFEDDVNVCHCLTLDFPVAFSKSPYIKRQRPEVELKVDVKGARLGEMEFAAARVRAADIDAHDWALLAEEARMGVARRAARVNPVVIFDDLGHIVEPPRGA